MNGKDKQPSEGAAAKTARVTILKDGVRVGNHRYAAGAEIAAMPVDEVTLRTQAGDVELIAVNPT